MEGNWVCLHRKILDSEIHDRPNLAWLFVTCILMANWKPTFYKGFELQRGQFATSHTKLGKRTGLSRFQVLRGLKVLAEAGMVTEQVVHNRFTVITVCNYETYQDTAQVTRTPSAQVLHTSCTPSAQASEEQREEREQAQEGEQETIWDFGENKRRQQELEDRRERMQAFLTAWQDAPGKNIRKMTAERQDKLATRVDDPDWIAEYPKALAMLPIGDGEGWQPDFDWMVNNSANVFKLTEGKYSWRTNGKKKRESTQI